MIADDVADELDSLGVKAISPGQAALALDLARAIDDTDAPTAKAVVARELRTLMQELRRLAPVRSEGDEVDELLARRKARRGA